MSIEDIDIVKECLDGNGEAYEVLVSRYKKQVYNIAYRFSGNREDALDITQEAFIKAYNSLKKYDPKYKFSSWILKITTNYCLDLKKKKSIETVTLNTDMDNRETTVSAEEVYIHKSNSIVIKDAINSLPEEYRILIIMYHNENLSYNEISEILKIPLTKVKNRLYRGRNMLKETLENIRREESKWDAKKLRY